MPDESRRPIETRPAAGRRHAGRSFALFLLGSVAVHAAMLVAIPGYEREAGMHNAVILEVALQGALPVIAGPRGPATPPTPRRPKRAGSAPSAIAETPVGWHAPALSLEEPREFAGASPVVEPDGIAEPAANVQVKSTLVESVAPQPLRSSAAYLRNPAPPYPEAARRSGKQGTVTLRVRVARDGAATRVTVEKSSGSPHLDAAALEAVKAWRFKPARRGADAVESWMLVPIVFRLEGAS